MTLLSPRGIPNLPDGGFDTPRGINILNGCEGTEVFFLLASALLVAPPIAWRARLTGLLPGCLQVFALNRLTIESRRAVDRES